MAKSNKILETQQGERYGLFGASGSGKTTKARQLIGNSCRLIVFDSVKGEWAQKAAEWLGRGAVVVDNMADFVEVLQRKWQKGFRIVYRPQFGREVLNLHEVASIIWQAQAGFGVQHNAKITLFVDEAQEGAPAGLKFKIPNHGALRLATMGRGRGINFIVASQRIKSVDINIRSNLTGIFIFRLSDLADIQEARRILLGKGDAGEIPNFSYFFKDENGRIKFFEKK